MKRRIIIKEEAVEYLKKQSSEMKALIDLIGEVETYLEDDPFISLISQIIYQSISFKAATTIWNRFYDNYSPITPDSILAIPYDELKAQGLSHSKTKYIINIANAFKNNEINTDFNNMTDEEIIKEVTKIKGIGVWTAEMFLIFSLDRPNIISYGDIAIRKGVEWLYDIDHSISKAEFEEYRKLFAPYNTTASHYLWEITIRTFWDNKKHLD